MKKLVASAVTDRAAPKHVSCSGRADLGRHVLGLPASP